MQAFGLFALTAGATLTGDPAWLRQADATFEFLEDRFHDAANGGYRDWDSAPPAGAASKTANTNLHVLEALLPYSRLRQDSLMRDRIAELLTILSDRTTVAPGAAVDDFDEQWRPLRGQPIPFGHNLETAWLLVDAAAALGASHDALHPARARLDYALQFGFDQRRGGFYTSGPVAQPATARAKVWWVQAEGLICARMLADLTGEERYERAFRNTLRWIVDEQTDWKRGDWHRWVGRFRRGGLKAGPWQDPYHQGRALLRVLAALDAGSAR